MEELEAKVQALESLVRDLQGRIQVLEAAVDRSSLDRIRYVRYEEPIWVDPAKVPGRFSSEGLGPK